MNNQKKVGSKPQDKRRPSIELAPSLQKPVYIISKNMNGQHLTALTDHLDQQKIVYQMQQETSTLGSKFNQRFFVIVDNKHGEVVLGPQFGSILMTIVGYPRVGTNKKNKYFGTPKEIVDFYLKFKADSDISDRQKTLIQSQFSDIVLEKGSESKINNKIVVRSISKYKGKKQKEEGLSSNDSKDKINQENKRVKLLIVEDKHDESYSKLCEDMLFKMNGRGLMEKIQLDSIYQKCMFHTKDETLYFLTNKKNKRQLINTITVGEIIVFTGKNDIAMFKSIMKEQKIYAICSQRTETIRILQKIGVLCNKTSPMLPSSLLASPSAIKNKEESTIVPPSPQENIRKQQPIVPVKEEPINEISRISALQSQVSHIVPEPSINASLLSQNSNNSKKIKRLKVGKSKISSPTQQQSQYYPAKKENEPPSQIQRSVVRKKTLKSQQKSFEPTYKSKKSLKFQDEVQKMRRVKSISKCQPQAVSFMAENIATMTEKQYFPGTPSFSFSIAERGPRARKSSQITFTNQSVLQQSQTSNLTTISKDSLIHGVFYREFIPQFHNLVQLIKMNPQALFKNSTQVYQSFFNTKEFDRSARKIKQKLRVKVKGIDEFNFLVFLLEQDFKEFQEYCQKKNVSYNEDQTDMDCTFKTNFSSIGGNFKINMFVFIQTNQKLSSQVVDYGYIRLIRNSIKKQGELESGMVGQIAEKVTEGRLKLQDL